MAERCAGLGKLEHSSWSECGLVEIVWSESRGAHNSHEAVSKCITDATRCCEIVEHHAERGMERRTTRTSCTSDGVYAVEDYQSITSAIGCLCKRFRSRKCSVECRERSPGISH